MDGDAATDAAAVDRPQSDAVVGQDSPGADAGADADATQPSDAASQPDVGPSADAGVANSYCVRAGASGDGEQPNPEGRNLIG